jgi:hypothetical protein
MFNDFSKTIVEHPNLESLIFPQGETSSALALFDESNEAVRARGRSGSTSTGSKGR